MVKFLRIFRSPKIKDNCKHNSLKIKADFCADPIWCKECNFNLDLDDFLISKNLKEELTIWVLDYKKIPINEHNKRGLALTKKVESEIGNDYPIIFIEQ